MVSDQTDAAATDPLFPRPPPDFKPLIKRHSASPRQLQLQTCRDAIAFKLIDKGASATARCLTSRPTPRAPASRAAPRVSTCKSSVQRTELSLRARVSTAPSGQSHGRIPLFDEIPASSLSCRQKSTKDTILGSNSTYSAQEAVPERGNHWYIPAFYFGSPKIKKLLQGPLTSTAGDLADAFEVDPSNPTKIIASKKYFAPRGFGTIFCKLCCRSFMTKALMIEHERSHFHQARSKAIAVEKDVQHPHMVDQAVSLREFDAEYFELESDSDKDSDLSADEPERVMMERIRIEKSKFFEFVRYYEDQKCNTEHTPKAGHKQSHDQVIPKTSKESRSAKLRYELKESIKTNVPRSENLITIENMNTVNRLPSPVDERVVFLEKCQELKIPPTPCLMTRRRENIIDMTHYGAGDKVIQAVASTLKLSKGIQILSLSDNCIGEQGCVDVMEALRQNKNQEIHTIDLSKNQIGLQGACAVQHAMQRLTHLDLSSNRLGDSSIQAIMLAVAERSECLRTLILKDNIISSLGGEAVASGLRSNKTLSMLDLSWNAIRGKGAGAIGSAMNVNHSITSLNLAWNGVGGSAIFDSWADCFENNTCLTDLNLRHNNLDERNSIIITENIRYNETIRKLDISENPLGPTGGKLVFKLMDSFGANREFIMENCNFDFRSRHCDFDPSNPQGKYALDLTSNYERSIAKALIRIAGNTVQDQMKAVTLSKKKFEISSIKGKPQNVPHYGILEFEYYKLVVKANKSNVISSKILHELQAVVSSDKKSEMDRLAQMTTLSEEMAFSVDQLGTILEKLDGIASTSHLRVSVVVNLFSRLIDRAHFTVIEEKLTKEEQATVRRILGELYYFNEENPTAHYRLHLERKYDRSLANKIWELNNEERVHRMKHNYADTSQKGNMMNFRNETLNGIPFTWNGGWTIPKTGILEFDYVSVKRPTIFNHPLQPYEMNELLTSLAESETDVQRLDIVRQNSFVFFFTTDQACEILRIFHDSACKVAVAVTLHQRITDIENYLRKIMELLRNGGNPKNYAEGEVPSIEDDREILQVLHRIGWLNVWNPLDPDVMYRLDLSQQDEYIVTQCLVSLAVSEPGENWDGETIDGREFELPSTWIKAPPRKGFLEVHYRTDHVSEETVKSKLKRGDNFALRVNWLKKTLLWEETYKVTDLGFQGNDRAVWNSQRSWEISKPLRLRQAFQFATSMIQPESNEESNE